MKMSYKIGIYGLGLLLCISCQKNVFQADILGILNTKETEVKVLDTYEQFGGFGEGFAWEEYSVSPEVVADFLYPTAKILPSKNTTNSNRWQKVNWMQGPPSESLEELFLLCLSYEGGNEKIAKKIKELRELVTKQWVYYSFYYVPSLERPEVVQMFILDARTKKIYAIESSV